MVVNTFFYDAWYNFNFQPFYVDLVNTKRKISEMKLTNLQKLKQLWILSNTNFGKKIVWRFNIVMNNILAKK